MTTSMIFSPAFRDHVANGVELHSLFLAGKADSPETEPIYDRMDDTWKRMTEIEIDWDRGIAEDLNMLEDPLPLSPPSADEFFEFHRHFAAVYTAPGAADASRGFELLHALRVELRAHPRLVVIIRPLQARIYHELGLTGVAGLFESVMKSEVRPVPFAPVHDSSLHPVA